MEATMRRYSKLILAGGALLAIGIGALAGASPIGTPAANRVPTGNGNALGGLFDVMVGGADRTDAKAKSADGRIRPRRKRLTSKQWRDAYIARHGHDLPSPLNRPGGH
jgi:hypothetical protein